MQQAPQPAIEQIQSLIDRGDYRPAIDAANRLIAQSPRHSEAYRLRANARRNLNDLAGALEDADKAVELDPSNARALGGRAIVKRLLKDAPGSLTDANRAIELSPQTPGYLVRRGTLRRSLKDPAGADRDLTKAIALAPTNPLAYFQRGLVRLEQKRWDEAIADNTRAIDLKIPNTAAALNNRALAYKNRGLLAEARRDFDQALKIQPGDSAAAGNLARLDKLPAAAPSAPPPAPAAATPRAPAIPKDSPPKVAPEGDLEFLYRTNFLRITSSGSVSLSREDGTTVNIDIPIGGLARFGFPVQWNGDEFYYSGPSFAFDKKRYPSTYRSTEALPAVRTRLDTYWKRPPAWARIIALSEERLAAMFPRRSATPAKPAP